MDKGGRGENKVGEGREAGFGLVVRVGERGRTSKEGGEI